MKGGTPLQGQAGVPSKAERVLPGLRLCCRHQQSPKREESGFVETPGVVNEVNCCSVRGIPALFPCYLGVRISLTVVEKTLKIQMNMNSAN